MYVVTFHLKNPFLGSTSNDGEIMSRLLAWDSTRCRGARQQSLIASYASFSCGVVPSIPAIHLAAYVHAPAGETGQRLLEKTTYTLRMPAFTFARNEGSSLPVGSLPTMRSRRSGLKAAEYE